MSTQRLEHDERYRECQFVISSFFDAMEAYVKALPLQCPLSDVDKVIDNSLDLAHHIGRAHYDALRRLREEFREHADERSFETWQPYLKAIIRDGIVAIRRHH